MPKKLLKNPGSFVVAGLSMGRLGENEPILKSFWGILEQNQNMYVL